MLVNLMVWDLEHSLEITLAVYLAQHLEFVMDELWGLLTVALMVRSLQ